MFLLFEIGKYFEKNFTLLADHPSSGGRFLKEKTFLEKISFKQIISGRL
jgi:hypothetical protein